MIPLLEAQNLKKHFPLSRGFGRARQVVRAVDGVSFQLMEGQTLGLIGESGCGKSTTAQLLLRLLEPTAGKILFNGESVEALSGRNLRPYRRSVQAVFQNPYNALNSRMRVGDIIGEPLIAAGEMGSAQIRERVAELLQIVGLRQSVASLYPHEFSGGQRQRIAIARGLALQPKVLILDEPVSALDVSIRAQILNLLQDLQEKFKLSYILISHDLDVIAHMCDQIGVMYLGRIVELGAAEDIARNPLHPYTAALFSATLPVDPDAPNLRIPLIGEIPSPLNPPGGCTFHTRCPIAQAKCSVDAPQLIAHQPAHSASCHYSDRVASMEMDVPAMAAGASR